MKVDKKTKIGCQMWATTGVVVLILLENEASSVARSGWSGFNFEGKKTNGSLQMTINLALTGFNKCNGDAIAWMIFFNKERPLANNLSCADIPWKFNDTHITRTYDIPRVTLPMNCKKYLDLCSCSMWNIFPLLPEGIQIQAGMWHCNQSQRISVNVTSLETSPLKASCGQIENSCKTSHEYGILGNETNMFRPEFFNTYLVEYFSNENCYQHSRDVFCYVKFPGCNTSGLLDSRFICKETCEEALRGCSGVIRRMSGATTWKICDIYPSYLHDRFCWYKKVNCGIPRVLQIPSRGIPIPQLFPRLQNINVHLGIRWKEIVSSVVCQMENGKMHLAVSMQSLRFL